MGHSNIWNAHPKNYGPGSRTCRVCGNPHGIIRKYGLMCCRQCFRSNAKEIGFIKVNLRPPLQKASNTQHTPINTITERKSIAKGFCWFYKKRGFCPSVCWGFFLSDSSTFLVVFVICLCCYKPLR
ncbi:hypothetical protein RHMOL_Rhmol05G0110700 [Rhododendron molle]|uniref:Uncharacterized protein n=1 Tax=Rhododendron molle TaxID=49168 RepID=A0ACC0NMX4_RHOML|nr:hypothetical protein RHMOL_Rhmol05G0110700 [Rhododendron molle]